MKTKETKLTYEDVVKETIAFYSEDVTRRSVTDIGRCMYNGPNGKKCAFSRCTKQIDDLYEGDPAIIVLTLNPDILLDKYKHLNDGRFWNKLQRFHDYPNNWNDKGLTEAGHQYIALELTNLEEYETI